ncbi:MAG: RsmE family RNA methyltransferase [Ignavibacteriales bacterium]|nr:RsmE family RNA methyltransferase [Ignavibacteriales bacterium]
MSREFFYTDAIQIAGASLTLSGDESKHITRVLRKGPGERIWVTDGADNAYECVIRATDNHLVACEILSRHHHMNESLLDVTLAVGVVKNPSRMDWMVEKCTELGIRKFIPIRSERSVHYTAKTQRWSALAMAAMKQSMRCWLPPVESVTEFATLLSGPLPYDLKLILHETIDPSLHLYRVAGLHPDARKVLLLVGPEGGFSDEEVALAEKSGFHTASLGTRRLRTETAAVAATTWMTAQDAGNENHSQRPSG